MKTCEEFLRFLKDEELNYHIELPELSKEDRLKFLLEELQLPVQDFD
jgi:hypothetical protein